jgi:transposase
MLRAFCASWRRRSPEIARSAAWSGRRASTRRTTKRPHREREYLVQERVRIENRIAALLATQRVLKRPSLRTWATDLDALRTGDGRPLPPCLKAELDRLRRRLLMTLDMIREVEAAREQTMEAHDSPANQTVKDYANSRALATTFRPFWRRRCSTGLSTIAGRSQPILGLAPTPFQSGGMDRDRRINRAGNSRARKTMVQLAWLWLRYQPESGLTQWFRGRVGELQGRTRRIAIIAMARKLLIAIWRFVTVGAVPEGAILAA